MEWEADCRQMEEEQRALLRQMKPDLTDEQINTILAKFAEVLNSLADWPPPPSA